MKKAVLLDVDGTLVDSNEAHADSWLKALSEFQLQVDRGELLKCIGMGSDHLLPKLVQIEADSETGKKLLKRRADIFREEYLPKLVAFPGAAELLEVFRKAGLKLIVATSASKEDGAAILKQCDLESYIDASVCSDDAERSKPAPDIVLAALSKAQIEPADALMIGDTPYDIAAAREAGVAAIGFTTGVWSQIDLSGASETYGGASDLLAKFSRSPLFGILSASGRS